jgi:hypothetical protein
MAIAVQLHFAATLAQYDQVIEKMGFKKGGSGPPGLISHWVTATADGLQVTDVWESREQFDKFSEAKIGPITQEVGIPGPPRSEFFEVHNYLTAG